MLYKVTVLTAQAEPHPWDSLDGVIGVLCTTPDLKTLGEFTSADEMSAATAARYKIGCAPAHLGVNDTRVYFFCDGFGCIHASLSPAGDNSLQLSRRTWRQVGDLWLRIEPVLEEMGTWNSMMVSKLPLRRRFVNWFLRRTCGKCLYFDRSGAMQWRTQPTHSFLNNTQEAMWDDITKITAAERKLPDFQPDEFGYCPRRDCGLASTLRACGEFKRGYSKPKVLRHKIVEDQ